MQQDGNAMIRLHHTCSMAYLRTLEVFGLKPTHKALMSKISMKKYHHTIRSSMRDSNTLQMKYYQLLRRVAWVQSHRLLMVNKQELHLY
jgi:hypothetical protein